MSLVASFKTKDGKYYNSEDTTIYSKRNLPKTPDPEIDKETFLGLDDLDEIRKKAKEKAMRRIQK